MNLPLRRSLALASVIAAALGTPAAAHDLWITLSSGTVVPQVHLHYGHPDDLLTPQADKLVELNVSDATGTRTITPSFTASRTAPVLVSEPVVGIGSALVTARYDNGFWVKGRDGSYLNTTRRLVPEASEAITAVKFAKLVAGSGAPYAQAVGHDLELVPLDDPSTAKPGDKLRVKVLFRGVPLAGAKVVRSDGEAQPHDKLTTVTAGADGVATIAIEKAGGEILAVSRRVTPSAVPALADADLYSATLAYDVASPRTN